MRLRPAQQGNRCFALHRDGLQPQATSRKSNRSAGLRLSENNSNTVVLPISAATRIAVIVGLALTIHRMGASRPFLTGIG
jgi:hypothetical protein